MITTSNAWKEAHLEAVVPEAFIEITYDITEPGLQSSARQENNGVLSYAQPAAILDATHKTHPQYATLEQNIWGLDGKSTVLPDTAPYGDTGYVSSMFVGSELPAVRILLSEVHTQPIPGITITWSSRYDEYATRFRVSAYNGSSQIYSQEYTNSTVKTVCEFTLSSYTEIRIEVLEWCFPNRRARIEKVFLGIATTFTKSDIFSYSHAQSGDLLSAELPKNSVNFSLNNVDGMWNPDNLSGNAMYLAEQQQITVRYGLMLGDDVEWINAGTFWISEWDTPTNGMEVRFTARDMIEFMSEKYDGIRSGTLYDIVLSALEQAVIPTQDNGALRYVIDDVLKLSTVDFSAEETTYTIAEILQLCANAACCVMYQDRSGVLHIEPLHQNASGYAIRKYVSYAHPKFTFSKPLRSVSVNDGLGTATNGTTGEIQTVSNSLIVNGNMANRVANWVKNTLKERKSITGEYRADPSLDVFDKIAIESKYGANNAVYITEIEYTFNGSFKGKYVGRVTSFDTEKWYSGELISGEV